MKVLLDMNVTSRWVEFLATEGVEAIHWSSIGRAYDRDSIIMQYARTNEYIVLTGDLDFGLLLRASGESKPAVIQLRAQITSPENLGSAVISALRLLPHPLENGFLITIDERKSRARLLPFPKLRED